MAVKFMEFDFGEVAAIEGSVGMIWSSRSAVWKPSGGSEELALAVLTDEGSKEIPADEVETTLLGLGAPMPSFVANDESSLEVTAP